MGISKALKLQQDRAKRRALHYFILTRSRRMPKLLALRKLCMKDDGQGLANGRKQTWMCVY
eukprot:scaffold265650_cov15-Tisochrysis_lutea.AAC.1